MPGSRLLCVPAKINLERLSVSQNEIYYLTKYSNDGEEREFSQDKPDLFIGKFEKTYFNPYIEGIKENMEGLNFYNMIFRTSPELLLKFTVVFYSSYAFLM